MPLETRTMKIDLSEIDAAIAKLEKLRRLATDPAVRPFLDLNGNVSNSGQHAVPTVINHLQGKGRGKIQQAVLGICRELQRFTIMDVFKITQERKFEFGLSDPLGSVRNAVWLLASKKKIKVVEKAAGRKATVYEA